MLTPDEKLDATMRAQGLHFYREYFRWGKTPAYRNADRTVYRFVDRGDILTPQELCARLLDEWRPPTLEDDIYRVYTMPRELAAMELDQP